MHRCDFSISSVFVLFVSFIVLFSSCHHSSPEDNLKIFRYNQATGISNLDPAFASMQSNIWAVNFLYNGLVQTDSNLNIVPSIAKRWDISPDGKTYTFHLRNDVFFHDHVLFVNGKGRRVTGKDFVFSFQRIMDPNVASRGAWIFNNRVNGHDPFSAPDDSTFILKLKSPFPAMLGVLTMQYCSVVPEEIVEHYGNDFRTHPVGTGPFQFKAWKEGVVLLLFKNANYFERDAAGNRLPYIDGVRITFLDSKATEFLKFRQKEYDFTNDVDPSFKDDVLTKDGELQAKYQRMFRLQKSVNLNTEYLGFNLGDTSRNNPLLKKEIRQAINYSIDKEKMMLYLHNSIGIAAWHGFVPLGLSMYDVSKVKGYTYDPAKARALVLKAGYDDGKAMPPIKLLCVSTGEVLANFIVNELKQSNINATLETVQDKSLKEMMVKGEAKAFRASWIGDYPDAETFLALFYSGYGAPPNYTRFKNASFDNLYESASLVTNDSARNQLYLKMDSLVMEEAPVCPLYYDEIIRFVQNNVSGLPNNPMNLLDVKRVRIGR